MIDAGDIYLADLNEERRRRVLVVSLRRVAFIRVAQQVGLSLGEIRDAMASLPDARTPDHKDWARLSASWQSRLDEQMGLLERLRERLDGCIGCGCLSLEACRILNPDDAAGLRGAGPRHLLEPD